MAGDTARGGAGFGGGITPTATAPARPPLTEEEAAQVLYPGTPYETTRGAMQGIQTDFAVGDRRNFMFGRDPAAAQQAVDLAYNTGQGAQTTGENILTLGLNEANAAQARGPFMGDFTQQNAALQGAQGYGTQLAGLEAQQGPSGAQAQLQAGTNAGMASQLALARSGRGFGGGAAAAGQAQTNMAGLSAANANNAAMLSAQENAAWRQRQAGNLGAAAGIQQGIGSQFGEQQARNINAYYANQGQNDQAALGWAGLGNQSYFQGVGANFAGQGVANQVRGMEMQGNQAEEDRMLRAWAAAQGFQLQQDAAAAQQRAALIQGGATLAGAAIGTLGGPAGTAAGAAAGGAVGGAVTR